jgi:major vault protein
MMGAQSETTLQEVSMVDEDVRRRDRDTGDIVLAPNEWLLVRDRTKGDVNVHVGPCKTTISDTDRPVVFDEKSKRFVDTDVATAIKPFATAPEGYYIVLKNPAFNDKGDQKHPTGQGKASPADLLVGRKVNIPGPVSFPLFPGQMAKVIKGHNLRSNQYLLVRVYDEDAARKNWKSAVIKAQVGADSPAEAVASKAPDLTMGELLVIKGTEVAFYIPPTGIEVVADGSGNLVRGAVTLERLEYCLLRDEDGNKRYERGPAVVFPRPTEIFADRDVEKDGTKSKTRKFRAIELNENSGIYIKVIADHVDESGTRRLQGEELFITGKEQMIYFPREEHAIVKYDNSEIHYGIAIPAGEARYVLDRNKGDISVVKGPQIFLPDPRSQVVVRRLLDFKTCSMLYPGNQAALEHNATLAGVDLPTYSKTTKEVAGASAALFMASNAASAGMGTMGYAATPGFGNPYDASLFIGASNLAPGGEQGRNFGNAPARGFSGDSFIRKPTFTEPRTITLSTKYEGAVSCDIWPGYAMMLVRKSGERRVVLGPQTVLLEYDEQPQILALSRGKPKTTDNLLHTAFLLTQANKVSDLVSVETSDFCRLKISVSYRMNFDGDPEAWFSIENYTKFLTDHLRSKLRSATKKIGVEQFYASAEDFVRDAVLGKATDAAGKTQARVGTLFQENGMRVYDVEVLSVELDNKEIAQDLSNSQKEVIKHALLLAGSKRALEFTKESEVIKQQAAEATTETVRKQFQLQQQALTAKLELDLATLAANAKRAEERGKQESNAESMREEVAGISLRISKTQSEQDIALEEKKLAQRKAWLEAEVKAIVDKAAAVSPDLVAALNAFGERALIERVSEAMAPLAMIKQSGVMDVLGDLLKGTQLGKHLSGEAPNGTTSKGLQPRA